jgi:hypothetical protein
MKANKHINELNAGIDNTLYLPYNLPVYEYILMPQDGTADFDNFWKRYIQSKGENLDDFEDKLSPIPVYAVFKNENNNPAFLFEPINVIKPL